MKQQTLIAVVLVGAGILGLAYGGFTYTRARHPVDLGVVQLSVDERERINIPMWLGVALLATGGVMLLGSRARKE